MTHTRIPVSGAGFRPYDVIVGGGLVSQLGEWIRPLANGQTAVITDETVAALHGRAVLNSLEAAGIKARLLAIPPGEASKSFSELERVLDRLAAFGLDRSGLVVALGGGVVGDLAGLAAALYMRGVDYVQVPTTLLAQVDSSVGGKTAIDTPRGKNLIGAFHQPRLVAADIDLLATLPDRQLRSGWAEVLKHGLISDLQFFNWLAGPGSSGALGKSEFLRAAVLRSVEIKSEVVGADEREGGRRALLNLGHTFGHALEAELDYDGERLTHGEAVAIGCALAFRFSVLAGECSAAAALRVSQAIEAAGLPSRLTQAGEFSAERLVHRMAGDKKAQGGRIALVLARDIGRAYLATDVEAGVLTDFLRGEGAA